MTVEQGVFTAEQAIRLTGITRRQLDYWMRTDLIAADIASGSGRGSVRLFTFQNLLEIRVAAWLRDQLSLQLIRKIVGHLREQREHPLAELQFAVVEAKADRTSSHQSDVVVQRADGTWEKWTGQQMLKVRVPIRRFSDELTKAAAQDRSKRRKVRPGNTRESLVRNPTVKVGARPAEEAQGAVEAEQQVHASRLRPRRARRPSGLRTRAVEEDEQALVAPSSPSLRNASPVRGRAD